MTSRLLLPAVAFLAAVSIANGFPEPTPRTPGNVWIDDYFQRQTAAIEQGGSLAKVETAEDWNKHKDEYRRQLREMLGIDPLPERTDLKPVKTGEVKGEGYVIEKLHFQSLPGLYVTANFYRPEKVEKPLPAILYVCGHANMMKDGVSFGNKAGYHHHGVWFARHGYVCLMIDTLQLGEIRGEHHGTHNLGKWWWLCRGYTSAGVEAWNCMRALDYLETRPEADKDKFGVTGRSGGGAYSWWIAALDERIKAAAPTAGITSMRNHVVDGCVEGHCDCMYFVNTYRWEFDKVAALVAPRPLLIVNTDKDTIFPIDGVFSIYQSARRLYKLLGAEANIGLQVAEGPHKDLQPLNTGAFHWFDRYLKGEDPMHTTDEAAKKIHEPEVLRVFGKELPADQRNTRIDHEFVTKAAEPKAPESMGEWQPQRDEWMKALKEKVFRGWPQDAPSIQVTKENSKEKDGVRMTAFDFVSQEPYRLRLYLAHQDGLRPEDIELVALNVLDEEGWKQFAATYHSRLGSMFEGVMKEPADDKAFEQEKKMFEAFKWAMAYVCPRGVGFTAWSGSDRAQNQRLRRFYLLGQTADAMQVFDIRRSVQALRQIPGFGETKLWLNGRRTMAANALYASLFEDGITRIDLHDLPASHMPKETKPLLNAKEKDSKAGEAARPPANDGPIYFNVLKHLDIPQAAALAAERSRVTIYSADKKAWSYPQQAAEKLGWGKDKKTGLQLRDPVK